MAFQHAQMAAGRWRTMSLFEQLGNIGSEISRARRSRATHPDRFENAVIRALELFDLTLQDPRWRGRRKEIARSREILCDIVWGESRYATSLDDLQRYFDTYALAARQTR